MSDNLKDWKVLAILALGPVIAYFLFGGAWQPAVIILIATMLGFLVYWEIPWVVAVIVAVVVAITLLNQMGWFDPKSFISEIGDWFGSLFDRLDKSA